jgi:hypothetical protein
MTLVRFIPSGHILDHPVGLSFMFISDPTALLRGMFMIDETWTNQSVAANRRPAGQSDGAGNLSVPRCGIAADRAFPAAVAGRSA